MKTIGNKIKEIRKNKGLSQEALAENARLNLRTIQRIENNESEPRGKSLSLICDALQINVEDLADYGKKPDRSYLIIFQLSSLCFLILPLGNILIPLLLWLNKKDKVIALKQLGAKLLNFQIVWSLLCFICITGFAFTKIMHYHGQNIFLVAFISLYVLNIVLAIASAVKINQGKSPNYYPNPIRFLN